MAGKRPAGRESEAPRVTTLLRAVQRGDYGVLTSLLGSSKGCEEPWSLPCASCLSICERDAFLRLVGGHSPHVP